LKLVDFPMSLWSQWQHLKLEECVFFADVSPGEVWLFLLLGSVDLNLVQCCYEGLDCRILHSQCRLLSGAQGKAGLCVNLRIRLEDFDPLGTAVDVVRAN